MSAMSMRGTLARRGFAGRSRREPRAGRKLFAAAVTVLLGVLAATEGFAQKSLAPPNQGQNQGQNPGQNQGQNPAQNQGQVVSTNALQGFSQNRDQPVKIQSDALSVRSKDNVATFTGNVHVTQGDTELHSKVLVVYYVDSSKPGPATTSTMKTASLPGSGEQQIRRIEASGGVLVTQKEQNALGDTGVFDMQSNTVTLNGNVVVTRGKDVVRGQRMIVDLNTGVSRIEGGRVDALFGSPPNGEVSLPGPAPRP
jgi:lipopolysaccharide export system protein LptA